MKHNILGTLHIMWYESQMINETLDSIQQAISNAATPVQLIMCLNSQTYIEKPDEGFIPEQMFDVFLNHPVLENAIIIKKTDNEPFYNIVYNTDKPEGHPRKGFSCDKLRETGWEASISLKEGIQLAYKWYKQTLIQ